MSIRRDLDFQPERNGPLHGNGKAMWGRVTVRGFRIWVATNPKTGEPLASVLRRLGAAPAVTGYQAGGLWRELSDTNPYTSGGAWSGTTGNAGSAREQLGAALVNFMWRLIL